MSQHFGVPMLLYIKARTVNLIKQLNDTQASAIVEYWLAQPLQSSVDSCGDVSLLALYRKSLMNDANTASENIKSF